MRRTVLGKALKVTVGLLTGVLLVAGLYICRALYLALPGDEGIIRLAGLSSSLTVGLDRFGIPAIRAGSRLDAYRVLGFLTARDRMFQMDLMRRTSAGRLAEILGEAALDSDIAHRVLGFSRVAAAITQNLPSDQRAVLQAYVDGVNSLISRGQPLAFEFAILGYQPERWTLEDSILIVLGMFEAMDSNDAEERMSSVMAKCLPADVIAFLTPAIDPYTEKLSGPSQSHPVTAIPAEALKAILRNGSNNDLRANLVTMGTARTGSNAWAVSASKTADGRAILANDMHLGLSIPNIWYRFELQFGDQTLAGLTLPGTPLLVAGTNHHLAWGITSLGADELDLVVIETNPDDQGVYRTAKGWSRFDIRSETIEVRGAENVQVNIRDTIWGPIASKALLGDPVAIHWTALNPAAVDLGLLALDRADELQAALHIVNRTGGPSANVILVDDGGHIAWTVMGHIPVRRGFDGVASRSWADGRIGWESYIQPDDLPRMVDPSNGILVSANQRAFGEEYPHLVAHAYDNGYRAFRIFHQLEKTQQSNEPQMLALQLDSLSEFYEFYRRLALSVLSGRKVRDDPRRREIQDYLTAWDGKAEVNSLGIALLVEFRNTLANSLFAPFLSACRREDAEFSFFWRQIDVPLQRLLTEKPPELLPDLSTNSDWNEWILDKLEQSAARLRERYRVASLSSLNWGAVNQTRIAHPLSNFLPVIGRLLDMPDSQTAGCDFCVRFASDSGGATERFVISPGHTTDGILHMPGGQSGHPLSAHYRDQHPYWLNGLPIAFMSGGWERTLRFEPEVAP
ncbi:MAG: penicillin acylase family protein [Methylococcales bacterium]